jgi:serine/threonine-protein kinase
VLREAAAYAEEETAAKQELARAEQAARERGAIADQAERSGQGNRAVFEAAGAAVAMVEAQKQWLKTREVRRTAREATAGDLRRQIGELRDQLARYAEALEEDLAGGREKVANRTREGLKFEKSFQEASNLLIGHLKGKPECRELMNELMSADGIEQENGSTNMPGPRAVEAG